MTANSKNPLWLVGVKGPLVGDADLRISADVEIKQWDADEEKVSFAAEADYFRSVMEHLKVKGEEYPGQIKFYETDRARLLSPNVSQPDIPTSLLSYLSAEANQVRSVAIHALPQNDSELISANDGRWSAHADTSAQQLRVLWPDHNRQLQLVFREFARKVVRPLQAGRAIDRAIIRGIRAQYTHNEAWTAWQNVQQEMAAYVVQHAPDNAEVIVNGNDFMAYQLPQLIQQTARANGRTLRVSAALHSPFGGRAPKHAEPVYRSMLAAIGASSVAWSMAEQASVDNFRSEFVRVFGKEPDNLPSVFPDLSSTPEAFIDHMTTTGVALEPRTSTDRSTELT